MNGLLNAIGFLDKNKEKPAKSKQKKYKARAKNKGLLSLSELQRKLDSNEILSLEELGTAIYAKEQGFEEMDIDSAVVQLGAVNLSKENMSDATEDDGVVTLKDQVIFTNRNFHGLEFTKENLQEVVKNFAEMSKEDPSVGGVNANHNQNPEFTHSYFDNLKVSNKDGVLGLTADVKLNTNHKAFELQKYSLENDGLEIGFSIEVGFDGVNLKGFNFELEYVNPKLFGCATTCIPSAPGTLTQLQSDNLSTNMSTSSKIEDLVNKSKNLNNEVATPENLNEVPSPKDEPKENNQLEKLSTAMDQVVELLSNQQTALKEISGTVTSLQNKVKELESPAETPRW